MKIHELIAKLQKIEKQMPNADVACTSVDLSEAGIVSSPGYLCAVEDEAKPEPCCQLIIGKHERDPGLYKRLKAEMEQPNHRKRRA